MKLLPMLVDVTKLGFVCVLRSTLTEKRLSNCLIKVVDELKLQEKAVQFVPVKIMREKAF